jgi:hypothetical protein
MPKITAKKPGLRRVRTGVKADMVPGGLSGARVFKPFVPSDSGINLCVLQNRETKAFKWLSLESLPGTDHRYLYESTNDIPDQPTLRPAGCKASPASYAVYEKAVKRLQSNGYDLVSQL